MSVDRRYVPAEAEPGKVDAWIDAELGCPGPVDADGDGFAMVLPPPNVTGTLHLGHALNAALQDVLARLRRMLGYEVNWVFGTDHAGIATQKQVELRLEREGTSRQELGRDAFVGRVWAWREEFGSQITDQFKRLGASLDYANEHFTMDDRYAHAVRQVFVTLHRDGLIYRDHRIVNWDPGLRSAISDLEVEDRDGVVDTMYSIAYPLARGDGEIIVATTRPETMLADAAVAVHPDDDRYTHLVGEEVVLPLVGRRLPVIADAAVTLTLGTGALKVTPAHDPLDFEIGRRHGLPEEGVIGEDGLMTPAAGSRYGGLTVAAAQRLIVADLDEIGAIRARAETVHTVPFSQRSGERVQPLISEQWFMCMEGLAGPAIEAVETGVVRIHPATQSARYLAWLRDLKPWCISRQLWWGHQIPIWYRGEETYCGMEPPDGEGWVQDEDVLDTWFSSALWPVVTLGWPEESARLAQFYPTAVLSTARDILFLWVARMVMFGLRLVGDVPFRDVYVHSIIQAPDGRRMSKSLGTGIDPLDLVDGGPRPPIFKEGGSFPAYGADAVRVGLLAMSSLQDVKFNEEKIRKGRVLVNKLHNAARFVALRAGTDVCPAARPREAEDHWILSRLEAVKAEMLAAAAGFDFAQMPQLLERFVHNELCDWYLELAKRRLDGTLDERARDDLAATLTLVLRETVAVAHPVMPFVTEEIWVMFGWGQAEGLLAKSAWPVARPERVDDVAVAQTQQAMEIARTLRVWRDAVGVPASRVVRATVAVDGDSEVVCRVVALADVAIVEEAVPGFVVAFAGGHVAIEALDGIDAQIAARWSEERLASMRSEVRRAGERLGNVRFVEKAPADLVRFERVKLERLTAELAAIDSAA